jgi:lysophospholipase L1-like esterase
MGLLPGMVVYRNLPYARVYCSREGLGNSIMNRYGRYYPKFNLDKEANRIVLIGDSFIEGLGISPDKNMGVVLNNLLDNYAGPGQYSVLSLGTSGAGPAQYLEVLKYAIKYFKPSEVLMFIYLGNDFRDVYLKKQWGLGEAYKPENYIYYILDSNGNLTLHPQSVKAQKSFNNRLELNNQSIFKTLPVTISSYFLMPPVVETFGRILWHKAKGPQRGAGDEIADQLERIGLDGFVFKKNLSTEAWEAITICLKILQLCDKTARENGVKLHLVTIPVFPEVYYRGKNASAFLETGEYDFDLPEKILSKFAQEIGIQLLPMARYMQVKNIDAKFIKSLFFHGIGHFTEQGHAFFAGALFEQVWAKRKTNGNGGVSPLIRSNVE